MSKYYKAEDVLAIFSEEKRPLNWTDSEAEIQADNDFDYYKGMIESLPTIEVSEDCISREWVKGICEMMLDEEMLGHMLGYIKDAPSVVPNRAEGEWIIHIDDLFPGEFTQECPICHAEQLTNGNDDNYCPNCGAKMKGAEDDN